jgi:O-antigen ligase
LLLLVFVFAIPWEFSLDLGEPLGNVARLIGVLLLAASVPVALARGRLRPPGLVQVLVLALYLWFCLTCFWSIDPDTTLIKLRAFFQEMMVVGLVWEFAESPEDLRHLLRASILGCWMLALLTLFAFRSTETIALQQVRFSAYGQDPNDVARFLDLGLPLAALVARTDRQRLARWMALAYLPAALAAIVLTASRGGVLAALVAVAGSATLLLRGRVRVQLAAFLALPVLAAAVWIAIPRAIFERLATTPGELRSGSFNLRMEIWQMGWRAFTRAPLLGHGMGNFTLAAGLSPNDTAHNTPLAMAVGGGLVALFLSIAIAFAVLRAIARLSRTPRLAFLTAAAVWTVTSMTATAEESRFTWLLVALAALAARLQKDEPSAMTACFPESTEETPSSAAPEPLAP